MLRQLFKAYFQSKVLLLRLRFIVGQHLPLSLKRALVRLFLALSVFLGKEKDNAASIIENSRFIRFIHICRSIIRTPYKGVRRHIRKNLILSYAAILLRMRRSQTVLRYRRLCSLDKNSRQVRILQAFKPRPYPYKPFETYGKDVAFPLNGGRFFFQHTIHTIQAQNPTVYGFVEGIMHRGCLLSLIEIDGGPLEFGCFRTLLSVLRRRMILLHYWTPHATRLKHAIFFAGAHGYVNNYFHFMADSLPSLLLSLHAAHKLPEGKQYKVLCPRGLHANIQSIIDAVCAHFGNEIVLFGSRDKFLCGDVIMTGYPSHMRNQLPETENYSVSPLAVRYTRLVLRHVFTQPATNGGKFYITRADAAQASTSRHVANHKEIADFLTARGYRTVLAQSMTLDEQIAIYRAARHIVMDGGASIANLLFAGRCDTVSVLAMDQGTNPSLFVSLCQALGVNIQYIGGPVLTGQDYVASWQRTYMIPLDVLDEAVRAANAHARQNRKQTMAQPAPVPMAMA